MADHEAGEGISFVEMSLQRTDRVLSAMVHLAKAIELDLVDVTLNPALASNGQREHYVALGSKLTELAGISRELIEDISQATGATLDVGRPEPIMLPPEGSVADPTRQEADLSGTSDSTDEPKQPTPPAPRGESPHKPVNATGFAQKPKVPQGVSEQEAEHKDSLFDSLITLDKVPEMRPVDEAEAIDMVICGNAVVRVRGHVVELNPNEVFLLNGFLMLRDEPRSSSDIRDLGFEPEGKTPPSTAFSNTVRSLSLKLNQAAGKEIIKKIGEKRNTKYAVNPRIVLDDVRGTDEELQSSTPIVKKND